VISCHGGAQPTGRIAKYGLGVQLLILLTLIIKEGNTIDFLLTAKRDTKAALRFFKKSSGRNGKPGLVNIDKSGANKAGINQYNDANNRRAKIRQCKYLNNIIEQDHRRIKRITSFDVRL